MDLKYDPILGVLRKSDGIDTSDATAVAGDILNGKTAYGADGKLTGTIPTVTPSISSNVVTVPAGYVREKHLLTIGTGVDAQTITPGTTAQVIPKKSYLKGDVTIAGDANLTASNIKSGVTIFNVAGTYEGESTGGSSAEYYKCASVDTEAKTWSGCKAVFDSTAGTWSFESDVTAGLAYTSVTPVVGVIYTIDALVTVASVYTGFYATSSPLNPGSNNSGVWEITASSFLDSNRNAYKAFDEDLNSDSGCWHSQSAMPQWIQWRNTESKVLIKSYFLQNRSGSAGDYYPVEWTLSGSDDGVDWTELDNVVIQNSDTASGSKTLRNLASNNTAYYYHRITVTKAYNNSYATIGFLQAFNYLQE